MKKLLILGILALSFNAYGGDSMSLPGKVLSRKVVKEKAATLEGYEFYSFKYADAQSFDGRIRYTLVLRAMDVTHEPQKQCLDVVAIHEGLLKPRYRVEVADEFRACEE